MSIAEALLHLRQRAAVVASKDSRHRPHWTAADLEAVLVLVDRPAASEQIALARIEGVTAVVNGYADNKQAIDLVHRISRKALGLTA